VRKFVFRCGGYSLIGGSSSGVGMRGADEQTGALFSYLSPDALVPRDHPLRSIRLLVNQALEQLSPLFEAPYAPSGRTSIAPEKLPRAPLQQAFYRIRSECQLMEQVTYNMLFRWFIGLSMDAPVWDVTVFTKNREHLLAIMRDLAVKRRLSTEHFSVDGTLTDAWASMKSFRPKDGHDNPPSGPAAMPSGTSAVRSGAMRRMPRRPTLMPGSIARPMGSRRGSASGDTC
jgi:transposase